MANIIKIKRKTTTGAPTVGSLSDGEFCLNTVDSILYLRVDGTTLLEFDIATILAGLIDTTTDTWWDDGTSISPYLGVQHSTMKFAMYVQSQEGRFYLDDNGTLRTWRFAVDCFNPGADNECDLGKSALSFKDGYFKGTVTVNALAKIGGASTEFLKADGSVDTNTYLTTVALNEISDVTITSPSTGQVLKYNGTVWINDTDATGGGGATNLGYTSSATDGTVTSDTGTDATLPLATGSIAGLMAPAQFTKLSNVSVTQAVDLDTMESNIATNNAKVSADGSVATHSDVSLSGIATGDILVWNGSSFAPTIGGPATGSGTTLSLANIAGTYYGMGTASTDTSFTVTGAVLGGWAQVRTQGAASEPTVTGSTKIAGATWDGTNNFYLVVTYNGSATQHFFLKADNN